ncbi:MAG TPA: hypothetical protein VJT73_13410 [Polyangiaceae bacterium]|nr:hypothetical protein [Polyangiaceae bacterium]
MRASAFALFAVSSGALLIASCGAAPPGQTPRAQTFEKLPECPALRFLPLADGVQWAYDATDESGAEGMFVTRAKRLSGSRFSLGAAQSSHVVEVRTDGIVRVESETYALKAPLVLGAEWIGESGAIVRITAADSIAHVPAGKFVGCLETTEELRRAARAAAAPSNPARRVTTTYCPDVGVTTLRVEAWEGSRHIDERATLRSFGKPVELK